MNGSLTSQQPGRALTIGATTVAGLLLLALGSGCRTVTPPGTFDPGPGASNHRDWEPSFAVLPRAEFSGDGAAAAKVTIRNIRRCSYLTEADYVVDHYDHTFDLGDLETVDFIMVPFKVAPSLAHTMLSFGFGGDAGPRHIVISAEVRLEKGESYSPVRGALGQYEIMYVVGDERDLIQLRTEIRDVDVYLYPVRVTPVQARALLVDMLARVNQLAEEPELYDTLTNNCTTSIVQHVNKLRPGRVPLDLRVLLPGYSDRLAYDLGLIDTTLPFAAAKQQAHINDRARRWAGTPEFSQRIRLPRSAWGQLR